MGKKKTKTAKQLRGQLMLQIAAGRFFAPGTELNETEHRFTVYTNAWFLGQERVVLPVGEVFASTESGPTTAAMVAVVDKLAKKRFDGTDDFLAATGGTDLVDDVAYVMTFVLNRSVSRDHDLIRRLVVGEGRTRGRSAGDLFPGLFEPRNTVRPDEWEDLCLFMGDLIGMGREDFARVMRAIRNSVEATRRAIDDPTGAYTDLVAALESLADADLSVPVTWDRYDGSKRKIIDAALVGAEPTFADGVRDAVLEADRAGLKRRFVSSTLARVSPAYYRAEARGTVRPPRAPDLERMLELAYDIRSRRSHVLENLGEGVWLFTDGAETAYEPSFAQVLTLAGLWRLIRHVVRRYVADAERVPDEVWDYRDALPGIVDLQVAPQYWVWQAGVTAESAAYRFDGFVEALIGWIGGHHTDGLPLDGVCREIEQLVPGLPEGEARTALIATHVLWHEWIVPEDRRPEAVAFVEMYESTLGSPSVASFAVSLLSNRPMPEWTVDEWADLAVTRWETRLVRGHAPLPDTVDALIQVEAAEQAASVGRRDEALLFASRAVSEKPGDEGLLGWEERLVSGDVASEFDWEVLVFGKQLDRADDSVDTKSGGTDPDDTDQRDTEPGAGSEPSSRDDLGSGVEPAAGAAGPAPTQDTRPAG